ncbi:Heterokaryon incompatibility protein 6, OR allele [Pseudocercospora fuligena]|uniref:Heterokaryon incompatibility protein 6, OR allele n=1 Tax=Pseudocercospora fuligena TaxID=685502 RepID=A0A8H6VF34_9PEZI|nr:Heterokaryon incompatibility protein 6, OR allele [Pseudocercospora fuligena]
MSEDGSTEQKAEPFDVAKADEPYEVSSTSNPEYDIECKNALAQFLLPSKWRSTSVPHSDRPYLGTRHRDEIRLFELVPANADTRITGKLFPATLDFKFPAPRSKAVSTFQKSEACKQTDIAIDISSRGPRPVRYTALSYFWGSPDRDCTIMIDDYRVQITRSLDEALRHLRDRERPTVLWVDQICIDQTEEDDKKRQIPLMGRIYQHAYTTVIWLGGEDNQNLFQIVQIMNGMDRDSKRLCDEVKNLKRGEREVLAASGDSYKKLDTLLQHPWFTRTWIIQEVCMSNRAYLLQAHSNIAWETFADYCGNEIAWLFREGGSNQPQYSINGWKAVIRMREIRSTFIDAKHDEDWYEILLHALLVTRYANATKPADKVFGILGLCSKDTGKRVMRLSRESLPTFLTRVSRYIINRGSKVSSILLGCIDHPCELHMPSWAVDWSKPRVTEALGHLEDSCEIFTWKTLNAGDPTELDLPLKRERVRSRRLELTGKRFDTIAKLSMIILHTKISAELHQLQSSRLKSCIDFATISRFDYQRPGHYRNFVKTKDGFPAFIATMTAGLPESLDAPERDRQEHLTSVNDMLGMLCDTISGKRPTFRLQTRGKDHLTLKDLEDGGELEWCFDYFRVLFTRAMLNRCLCWTSRGLLGLVPRYAEEEDEIWVLPHAPVPFVLRPTKTRKSHYTLIGECYCHEIMDGKLMRDKSKPLRRIVLV